MLKVFIAESPLRLAALAALSILALDEPAHATNGYFSHGYGVQSQGIAGAGIALPQDGLAAATNPAGTALIGDRLDLGLSYFAPSRGATIEGNVYGLNGHHNGNGKKQFFIPEFGYTRHLSDRLSVGLAVYGNGGMNTQYNANPFASIGGQGPAGVNLEQLFVSPSLAFKVTPDQALGLALNLAHQRFSAQGLQPFTSASSASGNVTNQGTDSSTGVGFRLGWNGQIAPGLRGGVTWSSKISGRFDKYKGLFADSGSFDIPANYGVGVSYQPAKDWTLTADYQVIEYSGVKSIALPLSQLFTGNLLGSANGPGFGWKDTSVIKLGGLYQLNSALTLRAGYSHATQPVPPEQTFFNILAPGVVQDHVTAGFTWKASAHAEWSGFWTHGLNQSVNGQQSIPSSFGGGETHVHLKEDILGVAYGWKF